MRCQWQGEWVEVIGSRFQFGTRTTFLTSKSPGGVATLESSYPLVTRGVLAEARSPESGCSRGSCFGAVVEGLKCLLSFQNYLGLGPSPLGPLSYPLMASSGNFTDPFSPWKMRQERFTQFRTHTFFISLSFDNSRWTQKFIYMMALWNTLWNIKETYISLTCW